MISRRELLVGAVSVPLASVIPASALPVTDGVADEGAHNHKIFWHTDWCDSGWCAGGSGRLSDLRHIHARFGRTIYWQMADPCHPSNKMMPLEGWGYG